MDRIDNLEKDIIGAKSSVNAITLQKKHTGVESEKNAKYTDLIFDNFLEIHDLLKSIKDEKKRK